MKLAKHEKNNSMNDVVQGQGGDWVLVKIGLGEKIGCMCSNVRWLFYCYRMTRILIPVVSASLPWTVSSATLHKIKPKHTSTLLFPTFPAATLLLVPAIFPSSERHRVTFIPSPACSFLVTTFPSCSNTSFCSLDRPLSGRPQHTRSNTTFPPLDLREPF